MNSPVGVFDSGVGGTSIWREMTALMPFESTLYLADSKNAPYGNRSKEEILQLSVKNTEILLKKDCKLIVVACNTATTNAIAYLRQNYRVPFIGIEPAIKPAALNSKTKKVGVLATKGTLSSALFQNTSKLYASGITVLEKEGEGLVELIEKGESTSDGARALLQSYVGPMVDEGIDTLVLGCTHYPYLVPLLKEVLPSHVQIIDSGYAVAKQTFAVLEKHKLLAQNSVSTHRFFTNGDPKIVESFVAGDGVDISFLNF